eukprot:SAG31_NODE_20621_length_569_cov_1.100000_1_plen_56_part_10
MLESVNQRLLSMASRIAAQALASKARSILVNGSVHDFAHLTPFLSMSTRVRQAPAT